MYSRTEAAPTKGAELDADGLRLGRQGAFAFGFTGLTLGVNLLTGVLTARTLGASGRGELTAIMVAPQLLAWIFAFGCAQAASYHQARRPQEGSRLIGTWLVLLIPLSLLTLGVGEALLPALLSAQSDAVYGLARIYMLTVVFALLVELAYGVLLGDHDFFFFNFMRFAQPAALATAYGALWAAGHFSVEAAVAVNFIGVIVGTGIAAARVIAKHGLGRPEWQLGRSTFWYALRAHGSNVGVVVNARLDVLIIPAFVSATTVGYYSIATNVSWVIPTLAGALLPLVLPAAARQGRDRSARTVIRSLQATIAVGVGMAVLLAVLADFAIDTVYGPDFEGSVKPLRILLPGCVLYAAAGVLTSGLAALNKPFTATLIQTAGAIGTVLGLLLFLDSGGITAAALVSTLSYGAVFVAALISYRRAAGLAWRALVQPWLRDADWLRKRLAFRVSDAWSSDG